MERYNSRKEVPEKYKWDLTDVIKDEKEEKETFKYLEENIPKLNNYKGCTKNPEKLKEFMDLQIEVIEKLLRLEVYAYTINDQELGNSTSINRLNKTTELAKLYGINTSFFAPELLKLTKEEYDVLVNDNLLKEYKDDLDKTYREKEHILSEDEEKLITTLTSTASDYSDMSSTMLNSLNNYGKVTLDDGTREVLTTTNYRRIQKNIKDSNKRKKIYNQFYKIIDQYSASQASFLNGYVKTRTNLSKVRKYKSSWDEKLFDYNMPNEAYKALRETCESNLDKLQKYYDLKREELGLETLNIWDLPLEMTNSKKEYSIEEAQKLCLKAVEPLGEDYVKHFNDVFEKHCIDYCQYKGKCSGGYSINSLDKYSKILLSFNEDLDSVSTIIHEGGHNVHHQYIYENNKPIYREIQTLVAEVASLTNECLLSSYLAKSEDKKEAASGIANFLGVFVSNFYGAVREAKMEQDMYEYVSKGNALTKEYLNDLTKKSLKKYYGKSVKLNKYAGLSWNQRSHYYMFHYLYNYSFCISVASYIASKILDGDKEMLSNYHKFLSTGGDVWPIEAFKVLKIDLCDKKVYEDAIKYFDTMLEKYKEVANGE